MDFGPLTSSFSIERDFSVVIDFRIHFPEKMLHINRPIKQSPEVYHHLQSTCYIKVSICGVSYEICSSPIRFSKSHFSSRFQMIWVRMMMFISCHMQVGIAKMWLEMSYPGTKEITRPGGRPWGILSFKIPRLGVPRGNSEKNLPSPAAPGDGGYDI